MLRKLDRNTGVITNADVEQKLAQRIAEVLREVRILRPGYQCEVHLHRGNRKKRRDAEFEGNWDPDTDSIRVFADGGGN